MVFDQGSTYLTRQDSLDGPALDPPHGIIPNPSNEGQHTLGYVIIILACVLSSVSVLIRFISRIALKTIRLEDFAVVAALGFFAGESYLIYDLAIYPGLGLHQWDLQLKHLSRLLYYIHVGSILYNLLVMCLKIAILLDFLRLFIPLGQRNWLFWTLHGLIWANIALYGIGTLLETWRCSPREKIWNPLFAGGTCVIGASNLASGVINIVSDILILALPQWVIWNLHITRAKRVGVSLLFVIGFFACVCSTIRLVYLIRLHESQDTIYYTTFVAFWGVGETTIGFLILGIPSLPKVVHMLPFADTITSLFSSLRKPIAREVSHSRIELSWRKPVPGQQRDQWEISDLDTQDLVSVSTTTLDREETRVV